MHKSLKYFLMMLILGLVLALVAVGMTQRMSQLLTTLPIQRQKTPALMKKKPWMKKKCRRDDLRRTPLVVSKWPPVRRFESPQLWSLLGPTNRSVWIPNMGSKSPSPTGGELLGHALELQAEDDGCSAEGGQTAGQKIVSDPSIVGVIGTSCSGAGVPMSQIVCDAGIAMISPSNTAPVLTGGRLSSTCYFRTAHNDTIQGAAMATFVYNDLGLTKAAAIHDVTHIPRGWPAHQRRL